ncbi:twin-arginine translocase TatA/TatE family subunit [Kribbella sp. NPDC051718]|uniref:twin-arginine translocase TatA/TatE family subunit n=1 Tax=Kribbella sp. NPDC051718 TaxID=3155168 RepID=UPI0034477A60
MASLLALPEGGEWSVLLVIVVLIFGANKLPDLTRNVGKALVEFRKLSEKPDPQDKPQTTEEQKPQL